MWTVLVVDDDELLRETVALGLERMLRPPTRVVLAKDPDDALRVLAGRPGSADGHRLVLLTDLDMRVQEDGLHLIHRVAQEHPASLRLLMTGADPQRFSTRPEMQHVHKLLPKPFRMDELLATIEAHRAAAEAS